MSDPFERQVRAIANPQRLTILDWLKDPRAHFRPQIDGDLVDDGVCALLIGEKLALSQPTTAQHLKLLVDAGLLIPKRTKKWIFYKRDEQVLAGLRHALTQRL